MAVKGYSKHLDQSLLPTGRASMQGIVQLKCKTHMAWIACSNGNAGTGRRTSCQ